MDFVKPVFREIKGFETKYVSWLPSGKKLSFVYSDNININGQRVVVVRVFIKKTQKTPNREIELALRRSREIQQ